MNKKAAQRHEEERKKQVVDKMIKNQQQQDYIAAVREKERSLNQREKEALSRKREYQAHLAKERELEMKEFFMEKFNRDEEKVAAIQSMKEKEMSILKEERNLHSQMKRDNVDRIKRMQEYKRLETMKKISENYTRTEQMMKKKEELAKTRQKNAVEAKIRRDKLMQILEKSKTSGGKAIKKILSQLENDEALGVTKKKLANSLDISSSKSNKKVPSKSSGGTKPPSIVRIEIGPPPEAPSLAARMKVSDRTQQYISPYASSCK